MRLTKRIDLDGRAVEVKELTLAEIRAWLKDLEGQNNDAPDVVGSLLFEEFTGADLARITDLAPADLDAMGPSEVRRLFEAAKEVNADFFGLRGRLAALGRAALETPAAT